MVSPKIQAKLNVLFWPHTEILHIPLVQEGLVTRRGLFILPNGSHRTEHRTDRLLLAVFLFPSLFAMTMGGVTATAVSVKRGL